VFTAQCEMNIWIKVTLSVVLKGLKMKISSWGQQAICVCVCVSFQLWNDKREGSRMPLVTVVPLDSTFTSEDIALLSLNFQSYYYFQLVHNNNNNNNDKIARPIIYINYLLLQSGLSENIFRSFARNCLLVLWLFKICLFEPFKERLCCIRN
jgi:hypothetical protein